jgi:hypothetical protein
VTNSIDSLCHTVRLRFEKGRDFRLGLSCEQASQWGCSRWSSSLNRPLTTESHSPVWIFLIPTHRRIYYSLFQATC